MSTTEKVLLGLLVSVIALCIVAACILAEILVIESFLEWKSLIVIIPLVSSLAFGLTYAYISFNEDDYHVD